jgi:hypothetical protein
VHRQSRRPRGGAGQQSADGVESNERLTGTLAAILLVLLAAEGATILRIHQLINVHILLGMLVVPPVLLKIGSTTWRFARYYTGSPAYRRKGPPRLVLRLLGPIVVVLSVILLATGIGLIALPASDHSTLLFLHKASFVLWFAAMVIHVLGHLRDTARLAPLDYARRTRNEIAGAGARNWAIAASLVIGILLAVVTYGHTGGYGAGHVGQFGFRH